MAHWNNAFWVLFIIMGALVIAGFAIRVLYLDLVLGFFVIAIGVFKLGEELTSKEISEKHEDIKDNIRYLSHQMDAGNLFTRKIKEKHEHRFLRLDSRRNEIESTVEEKYDSLAKKLIQLENKLNDVTKAIVEVSKRHDTFSKDTGKEIKKIGKIKERTDRMSEKLRKIRVKASPASKKTLKATKAKK